MLIFLRNLSLKRKREKDKFLHKLELQHSENERIKAELIYQKNELQMQALRAQMNPHFIFNSLNSINRFILQNEKTKAMEYLTKFSRLIRLVLQNSQSSLVSLESELEALKIYLELEALHIEQGFSFNINVTSSLGIKDLMIPPLIIQPYTENAIWHGLMHKDQPGHLNINVVEQGDQLCIQIRDDGIGREMSQLLKEKSKRKHESLGLKITNQRIALLDSTDKIRSEVTIQDLTHPGGNPAGTEVVINIPKLQVKNVQHESR
jgi:LytS/YehU family sensor histidine kinase